MTMEFVPSALPSPDKLSYVETDNTRTSEDDEAVVSTRNDLVPSNLSFESSNLFHFGNPDFFAPMKYIEEELTVASSPAESSDENMGKEGANDKNAGETADNTDILPSSALSPSNQVRHEEEEDTNNEIEATDVSNEAGRTIDIKARKSCPQTEMLPSHNSQRKSSIEMFLSQSPSQALGGDFLKLSLDDRQMSLQTNERAGSDANGVSGSRPNAAQSTNASYATGRFQLNPVQKSPNEYASLGGHYRHQPSPAAAQQQPQERYCDAQQQQLPTSRSFSRPSTVPGTSTAPSTTYSGAYTLTPRMLSEDSWSGSQDGDSNAYYHEEMQEYYSNNQMAVLYEQPQYRHQAAAATTISVTAGR
ncbi:unnamed protein product [Peronospora destructor]|uniref:Uncharacterized protein n=1 Tax=Peronospora destructor TaxID=86335 RepID=A0AAV0V7D7_9STRA|nr:unnamed protein product [Peronospora destructor]